MGDRLIVSSVPSEAKGSLGVVLSHAKDSSGARGDLKMAERIIKQT
jgi:hypothetical protein